MAPYNQRQTEQPMSGGQPMGQPGTEGSPPVGGPSTSTQQPQRIAELSVSTPTFQWISIDHPQERIPIGTDDYVLDSEYNHQRDAWEVLVLIQPEEEQSEADDEEDE